MWRVRSLSHNLSIANIFVFLFFFSNGKEQNAGLAFLASLRDSQSVVVFV